MLTWHDFLEKYISKRILTVNFRVNNNKIKIDFTHYNARAFFLVYKKKYNTHNTKLISLHLTFNIF